MAYGVKRGMKNPGEFGVSDIAGLGLSAAAGIVAALITDYRQSAEASALYTLNEWSVALGSILGFSQIPLWWVIAAVVGVGAGSIFFLQPITRQGAFAQGFGLLAVIMTAIPTDLASGLEDITSDANLPGLGVPSSDAFPDDIEASLSSEFGMPVNFDRAESKATFDGIGDKLANITSSQSSPSTVLSSGSDPAIASVSAVPVAIQTSGRAAQYAVRLYIKFENGLDGDVNALIRRGLLRGKLHNDETGQTFNLFRNAGGDLVQRGDTLIITAGVPARTSEARLWVRIECAGHKIEEQSAIAKLGQPLQWHVTVEESSTPLWMQRLGKVYRFN